MIFQTEKKKKRTVSFSPEKMGQYFQVEKWRWGWLLQSLLEKTQKKKNKLINNSAVKPKSVLFIKNEDCEYIFIDAVINELEKLQYILT